ncbi:MAG TPA: transposase [Dehalococcoidia bacterium]|nr:transposase [Dehalococcoidia bacterium]
MAMGKRKPRQESLFVAADQLAQAPGHPFYQKLNALLDEAGFDRWVERRCRQYYEQEETRGRPSVPPGVYFRMLFVGYFEGLGSQRGIAWRCADSLALRQFLGIPLDQPTPDHSTLTNTRKRLPEAVFAEVFEFVLAIAHDKKLLSGKTVGVDSTTLEANAAMKSIVRRDTGEDWTEYVTRLMREDGVIDPAHEPTAEEVRRFDKKRKNKRVSNEEWQSSTDGDARITQMKDGTTHLAYKAEHVVDLTSDLILAAEIYPADQVDTATLADSVMAAQLHLKEAGSGAAIDEAAADKGYHAAATIELCDFLAVRTYIPEPRRQHRSKWVDKPAAFRRAVSGNRRRVRRAKGKTLQRRRSEVCERTFAHVCETGGARRSWLRGLADVTKRYVVAAAAHNLGRLLRLLTGVGKPKALQGGSGAVALLSKLWACLQMAGRHAYQTAGRICNWIRPTATRSPGR